MELTHGGVIVVIFINQRCHVRVQMLLFGGHLSALSPSVPLSPFIQLRRTVSVDAVVAGTVSSSITGVRATSIFMSTSTEIDLYNVQLAVKHRVSVCHYGTCLRRRTFLSINAFSHSRLVHVSGTP